MSLNDFFDYLITDDETRELGADLAHVYLAHTLPRPVVADAGEAA
jgi:hypothetical protein